MSFFFNDACVPQVENYGLRVVFASSSESFAREIEDLLSGKSVSSRRLSREYHWQSPHEKDFLLQNKKAIIGGYLNLSEQEGWHEGSDTRLGTSFIRFILSNYVHKNKEGLGENSIVFQKTVEAIGCRERFSRSAYAESNEESSLPQYSRICYDTSVKGWGGHAVTRLVGNLGSCYDSKKPFFEILINSARHSANDASCHPFFISVFPNENELEKRRRLLYSCKASPAEVAHFSFYATYLKRPKDFLKEHQEKLGPNSTRLLQALSYLEDVTINAQKVGNCWIKQPMRCLLVSLYIELITHRSDLSPEQAWNEAKGLYKKIHQTVAIPFVMNLIDESTVTDDMKRAAFRALEKQKRL